MARALEVKTGAVAVVAALAVKALAAGAVVAVLAVKAAGVALTELPGVSADFVRTAVLEANSACALSVGKLKPVSRSPSSRSGSKEEK